MTPPDTNLEKQRRRHRPALYGMAFVAIFAILTLLIRIFAATDPDDAMLGADPTLREPLDQQEVAPAQPADE